MSNKKLPTSAMRVNPQKSPPRVFPQTDAGNAEFFAAMFKERLRYDADRKRWLEWAGHWWREDRRARVVQMAKGAARERPRAEFSCEEDRKAEVAWARSSESRSRLEAALKLAESEPALVTSGDQWDADPWLLGGGNGVVDLRRGKLREGKQSDLVTFRTAVLTIRSPTNRSA